MSTKELIKDIEKNLGCRILSMFYNTEEQAFRTQLALDVMPLLRNALSKLRMHETLEPLGLLLQSSGGVLESPWPIVSGIRATLRSKKNEFWVIVNEKAHSAATLIAISADKILMSPFGSLSPVDPQLNLSTAPNVRIAAGIEDIQGYYDLIKSLFEKDETARAQAFGYLAQRVPPEILEEGSNLLLRVKRQTSLKVRQSEFRRGQCA
jgi:ClpP class serine protease